MYGLTVKCMTGRGPRERELNVFMLLFVRSFYAACIIFVQNFR